ncbi:MAG TPA: hypothetical protein VEU97_14855 [Ktedonobacteraceae bacterium]|nr:hypothetical protein [Ktedonobacteraceae bacterium]
MRKLLSPKKCSCSYKKEAERDEHEKAKEETKAKKEKEEDSSTNETFMNVIKNGICKSHYRIPIALK